MKYFTFVLHSHLPWVIAHGTWPHGQSWLNEAAAETYIPLLEVLTRLKQDGIKPRLTLGLTPVLCEQLSNVGFKEELTSYLEGRIAAAIADKENFLSQGQENLTNLAVMWEKWYTEIKEAYEEKYNKNIIKAFQQLQTTGDIEIITCAATHGYLPLLGTEEAVGAQIRTGVESYKHHFGQQPKGIWLPECAYRPEYKWSRPAGDQDREFERKGIEYFLEENGIRYFIVDTPLLIGGEAIGVYLDRFAGLQMLWDKFKEQITKKSEDGEKTPYLPYNVGASNVAFFTRDPKTGILVWSGEHGYPGDGNYLDFHKKHWPSGLRYWKVTGMKVDLGQKMEYYPDDIPRRIHDNASHFKETIRIILDEQSQMGIENPILVAPYDAELYGHWWWEGPLFLEQVIRWVDADPDIELTTCARYLERYPPTQGISLPEGSWGKGNFHWIWFNEWTTWTWDRIYECEDKFNEIVKLSPSTREDMQRIIKQAARELLLLESSDWQFLISTWSARDYAEARVAVHFEKFNRLYGMAKRVHRGEELSKEEWTFLSQVESDDSLFPFIQPFWWDLPKK
ncbi:MAG: 1,4-alpha-glucan branching protein domain-containing protein [Candidatus Hodarchaeota archaeon]